MNTQLINNKHVKNFFSVRLIIFGLMLPLYWQMYKRMIGHTIYLFKSPLESMSHGWLIPFVSIYALWTIRGKLKQAASNSSLFGIFLVCMCLVLSWFGYQGEQTRVEQVSLIGLLWAVPFAFWGAGVARLLIFPVGYLVFTIPLSAFLDFFTVSLRLLSTSIVCHFMNGIGYDVQMMGNSLISHTPSVNFNLSVADGCSGIESFFAVMALTAAYAWFKQKTFIQKMILFSFAIPIAVAGNSIRLTSDCLVATWFGQDAVGGYYHDYSGFAVAFIYVVFVLYASKLVEKLDGFIVATRFSSDITEEKGTISANEKPYRYYLATFVPAVVLCLTIVLLVVEINTPPPMYEDAGFISEGLPVRINDFVGSVPWYCHNENCLYCCAEAKLAEEYGSVNNYKCPVCGDKVFLKALAETSNMPQDTVILKRNYRSGDGMVYSMNVVIGGRKRASIHRAEQCLPTQGYVINDASYSTFRINGREKLKVRRIDASRKESHGATLFYWFVSRKRTCSTHVERILTDVWDRSIHNRINRWVMFSVFIPSGVGSSESIERFEDFLSEFYPQVIEDEKVISDRAL